MGFFGANNGRQHAEVVVDNTTSIHLLIRTNSPHQRDDINTDGGNNVRHLPSMLKEHRAAYGGIE